MQQKTGITNTLALIPISGGALSGGKTKKETTATQWSPMKEDTDYYEPSKKPFMINYRVENLEELLKELEKEGVEIVGEMRTFDYGKFGWIMDPEGNKIELWEPVDKAFL